MSNDGATLRRRRLGGRLRALREGRHLTGEQAGRAIDRSASWISRVEMGGIAMRVRELRDLLDLYEVHDLASRDQLEQMATGRQQEWWSKYRRVIPVPYRKLISLEADASVIRTFEGVVLPGLVQTREYAEATFRGGVRNWTEKGVQDRTAVRLTRQDILRRAYRPQLSIVIDEFVIDQTIGGREVMMRQLDYVVDRARQPNVELRIVPYGKAKPTTSAWGFIVLDFPNPLADAPVAYVEDATGGAIEEGQTVAVYKEMFDRLRALALEPEESIDMVRGAWDRLASRSAEI